MDITQKVSDPYIVTEHLRLQADALHQRLNVMRQSICDLMINYTTYNEAIILALHNVYCTQAIALYLRNNKCSLNMSMTTMNYCK